jgi:chromosome segregation ATPase
MEKDTFESKLREARRQKSQVEQELESVSERWRNERRRLNSEIDRLETALADAKEVRRKSAGSKASPGIDPVEVAKMQAAAEERVKKAEKQLEAEREKARGEISRLQLAIADTIERSNNPMRSTEPLKEQFQSQLDDAFRAKKQVEEEFSRARVEWEEEKLKTTGELFKLRRSAQAAKAVKGKADNDDRVKELESRIEEATRNREAIEKQLQSLKKSADAEASRNREAIEKQLQTAQSAAAAAEERLRDAETDYARERRQKDNILKEAGFQLEEHKGYKTRLESQLKEAHALLQSNKEKYETEVSQLKAKLRETANAVSTDVVDQLRRQYDDKIHHIIAEKTQLSEELRNASIRLDEERTRFAEAASSPSPSTNGVDTDSLNAELARIEAKISEIAHLIDDPETELSTVIRKNVERAELDAYLKGILFSMGRIKGL